MVVCSMAGPGRPPETKQVVQVDHRAGKKAKILNARYGFWLDALLDWCAFQKLLSSGSFLIRNI